MVEASEDPPRYDVDAARTTNIPERAPVVVEGAFEVGKRCSGVMSLTSRRSGTRPNQNRGTVLYHSLGSSARLSPEA